MEPTGGGGSAGSSRSPQARSGPRSATPSAAGAHVLAPGTLLDGRYEIVRLLGQGGMAAVYQALHLGLRSRHAVKVLDAALAADADALERFLAEGCIQAQLHHAAIVMVTEIVTSPAPGLVMEYVEGRPRSRSSSLKQQQRCVIEGERVSRP